MSGYDVGPQRTAVARRPWPDRTKGAGQDPRSPEDPWPSRAVHFPKVPVVPDDLLRVRKDQHG